MKYSVRYPVIVHHSKYGYDVECPVLPGCVSQGKTYQEALENIEDAITTYLETIKEISRTRLKQKANHLCHIEVKV